MSTQHTPGPWKVAADYENSLHICAPWGDKVKPGSEETFGSCYGAHICGIEYSTSGIATKEKAKANARRIVACVNACEGIDPFVLASWELQGVTIKQQMDEAQTAVIEAHEQRDELLEALEAIVDQFDEGTYFTELANARALIAATKGGAA